MRAILFAALMLLAGASALPQVAFDYQQPTNEVVDTILDVIERIRERIVEAGVDPFEFEGAEVEYVFPLPEIFEATASVADVSFTGASDITVNDVSYSDKLTFDVTLPKIEGSVGNAQASAWVLDRLDYSGLFNGRIAIIGLGITGEASVDISGDTVVVSDLVVSGKLEAIESDIHLNLIGYDVSDYINDFLNYTLPDLLNTNQDFINGVLENIISLLLELVL